MVESKKITDELRDTITTVMNTRAGRAFVWHLLARAGIMRNPFHPDPHVHAFNSGQQNQGQMLYDDVMSVTPDAYLLMQKEAMEEFYDDRNANAGSDHDPLADAD